MIEHEFALYYADLSELLALDKTVLIIREKLFVHRVSRVLRLKVHDSFILFDDQQNILGKIESINKSELVIAVKAIQKNQPIKPDITVILGLLKRDALERSVESLTVVGVNTIKLFISEKIQRVWGGEKEYDRLQRLMIASAEQSKQFILPKLEEPISFSDIVKADSSDFRIFCDPDGESLVKLVSSDKGFKKVSLLVGPEGDLSKSEKEQLCQFHYKFCHLTPTILRSELAVILASGIIRSL